MTFKLPFFPFSVITTIYDRPAARTGSSWIHRPLQWLVALFDQPGCGAGHGSPRDAFARAFLDLPQGPGPKHSLGDHSTSTNQQGVMTGAASPYRPGNLHAAAEFVLLQLPPCRHDVFRARTPNTFFKQPLRDRAPEGGPKRQDWAGPNGLNSPAGGPNGLKAIGWNCCLRCRTRKPGDRAI